MDPAFAITSPFRNEAKALAGVLDDAIADVTSSSMPTRWAAASSSSDVATSATVTAHAPSGQTSCLLCGGHPTSATVPSDGIYMCTSCGAQQAGQSTERSFPAGTFACCPASTSEGDGGVIRCTACQSWYHCRCLGLHKGPLKDYATLSTTPWYCPQEACCYKVLQAHIKSRR